MNCDQAIKLMNGYLDGELDPMTNQTIEEHLRECSSCERLYKEQGALLQAVQNSTPYYRAPAELRGRIQASLRNELAGRTAPDAAPSRAVGARKQVAAQPVHFGGMSWSWLALAASIFLAAIAVWSFSPRRPGPDAEQLLATQLISGHVRSLMASHLTDVTSSDQHTVKPWLDAKLDFAPAVVDLKTDGFPLIGGRLDYLDNRPVAALVYQRRQHFINLFIWPTEQDATNTVKTITRQGYQLMHWVDADFNYWAVSDVNDKDLQTFKELFENQTPHH